MNKAFRVSLMVEEMAQEGIQLTIRNTPHNKKWWGETYKDGFVLNRTFGESMQEVIEDLYNTRTKK